MPTKNGTYMQNLSPINLNPKKMKKNTLSRRKFVEKTVVSTAAAVAFPSIVPSSVFGKNAPSNKIQVGQIGCGRIARGHDMPGTMQHEVAKMIAVCDLDRK